MRLLHDGASLAWVGLLGTAMIVGKAVRSRLTGPGVCACGEPRAYQIPESGRWVCDGVLHGRCRG